MGNLESTGGSIDIHSSDSSTYLGGNYVKALDDVTLHNKTILNGNINQKIQATTGKLTAKHHVKKINNGDLRLKGGDGIYLGGNVTTENGDLIFFNDVTANGTGGRANQKFNANAGGGKVLHAKGTITKTTQGDLTLMGGRVGNDGSDDAHYEIDLDGDVKVKDGSLFIGLDGQDDDTTVAAGGLLKASEDVTVFDTLYGEGGLTVKAGDDITLHKE